MDLQPEEVISLLKSGSFLLAIFVVWFLLRCKSAGKGTFKPLEGRIKLRERLRVSKEVELIEVQTETEVCLLAIGGPHVSCLSRQPASILDTKANTEEIIEGEKSWVSIIPSGSSFYLD